MKLLITGGCGFIGSNFIRYLLKRHPSYKIINLDKLTYAGNRKNLKAIETDKNYRFIKGDICDEKLVLKGSEGCDAVINFAAETHVDRSIKDATDFIVTNVDGAHALLEAVRKNGVKRYIQISTDEVYGSIAEGKFTEADPLRPNSPYAASKASADLLCRAYFITYKTPVLITRSSNNFGPYQYPEKVMPLFITNAIQDKSLPVYADGLNVRDWLYVEDNCAAIDTVLHKGDAGAIYNIGGGSEMRNIDLTRQILAIMGKPESLIKFVEDRPGHDKRYAVNCEKVKALGWRPKKSFNEALKETVEWYQMNEKWWKELKKCTQG
ncbi:MAG: dTDP-glucose 4,6-dehydratase [Candidatus Omnitrophica bacterium]|nr:dTDP-glucose 4,6-dehydratase [Candidatus Omnitrophota bacterium]